MSAEKSKQTIEPFWILLFGEYGEEENGSSQGVDDAERAKLVRRIDGVHLRVAAKGEQCIVVAKQAGEGCGEEEPDAFRMAAHKRLERIKVYGEIAADDKDENIMKHPVVEPIEQEALQHGIFHAVDHRVEFDIEAGKIIESDLQYEEEKQPFAVDLPYERNPKRHENIKPDEKHEEVKLVFCIAEEEQGSERKRCRETDRIKPAVMYEIKERPYEIRQDDGA